MPNSAGDRSQRRTDEILAGEYVLGVLSDQQKEELHKRLQHDPQFASTVQRWRKNLQRMENSNQADDNALYHRIYGEEAAFANSRSGLLKALVGMATMLWRSIGFWRTATVLLLLYLIVTIANEIG